MAEARLRAVVVKTSEAEKQGRACDMREIVNIASSLAKARERVQYSIPILEIFYSAKLGVYVCVYEIQNRNVRMTSQRRSERECDPMNE